MSVPFTEDRPDLSKRQSVPRDLFRDLNKKSTNGIQSISYQPKNELTSTYGKWFHYLYEDMFLSLTLFCGHEYKNKLKFVLNFNMSLLWKCHHSNWFVSYLLLQYESKLYVQNVNKEKSLPKCECRCAKPKVY